MFVKTIVVYTLPAVPWLTPIFTCSDRVGQGPGPDGAAVVAGAVEAGDAGAVAVVVLSDGAGACAGARRTAARRGEGRDAGQRRSGECSPGHAQGWVHHDSFWLGRLRE